jgi:ankyrin repeat protein
VKSGANVNALNKKGETALDLATKSGRTGAAAYLKSVGGLRSADLR